MSDITWSTEGESISRREALSRFNIKWEDCCEYKMPCSWAGPPHHRYQMLNIKNCEMLEREVHHAYSSMEDYDKYRLKDAERKVKIAESLNTKNKIITSVSSSIAGYTDHFFDDARPEEATGMADECKEQWDGCLRGDFDEDEDVVENNSGENDDEQFARNYIAAKAFSLIEWYNENYNDDYEILDETAIKKLIIKRRKNRKIAL